MDAPHIPPVMEILNQLEELQQQVVQMQQELTQTKQQRNQEMRRADSMEMQIAVLRQERDHALRHSGPNQAQTEQLEQLEKASYSIEAMLEYVQHIKGLVKDGLPIR